VPSSSPTRRSEGATARSRPSGSSPPRSPAPTSPSAEALAPTLANDAAEENPAAALGTALGVLASAGRDKLTLLDDGTGITGLGDWIEQLIAESTGKSGTGILPVVTWRPGDTEDELVVSYGGARTPAQLAVPGPENVQVGVHGALGAQFLAWEFATALAGHLLQIDPFNQPNVAESKENTARLLAEGVPSLSPTFTDGAVQGFETVASDTLSALEALIATPALKSGYLAVMAFLDRHSDAALARLRDELARATGRPVTFGWGPRFLHSTGQYHKGGPANGVFLQITGEVSEDAAIPGRPFSFGQLIAAQAAGDREALASRGYPLLRLHLTDRTAGVTQLLAAATTLGATA
jgi:glucose-6-phosphate isomerase